MTIVRRHTQTHTRKKNAKIKADCLPMAKFTCIESWCSRNQLQSVLLVDSFIKKMGITNTQKKYTYEKVQTWSWRNHREKKQIIQVRFAHIHTHDIWLWAILETYNFEYVYHVVTPYAPLLTNNLLNRYNSKRHQNRMCKYKLMTLAFNVINRSMYEHTHKYGHGDDRIKLPKIDNVITWLAAHICLKVLWIADHIVLRQMNIDCFFFCCGTRHGDHKYIRHFWPMC